MMIALEFAVIVALGVLSLFFAAVAFSFWKKSQIENVLSIQCSSGDHEVMTITSNFVQGECEKSKQIKTDEAFALIQKRRDENHAKWMKMKDDAIAEKKEPNLRSITEAEQGTAQ